MNKKIIFAIAISIALILGAIFAPNIKVPETWKAWKTYEDKSIGISFKYPSSFIEDEFGGGLIMFSSHENNTYQAVKINRSFGFGLEKTTENVFKALKLDPEPAIEKIKVDGKDAILATEPYDNTEKTMYVLVEDALFVISLYKVDPLRFYKSLSFDGTQSPSDYKTESVSSTTKRFVDLKYKYQFDIPSNFGYVVHDRAINLGLPFEGPGPRISLYVIPAPIMKATGDGSDESQSYFSETEVFEKKIKIDGISAVVTHTRGRAEEFPYYKNTRFVTEDYFFDINTQYLDNEAFWKSFRFINE